MVYDADLQLHVTHNRQQLPVHVCNMHHRSKGFPRQLAGSRVSLLKSSPDTDVEKALLQMHFLSSNGASMKLRELPENQ